jgi:tryptophan synthase alpha chain
MADGPVIQRSSERALRHGVSLTQVIGCLRDFRLTDRTTPVVLFGYANPIEALGIERFADLAIGAGADGVLVVDYPPEEASRMVEVLDARGIDTIFLLSPTTDDARLARLAALGRGYLYYVSLRGVTGASHLDLGNVATRIGHIRRHTGLPIGVGFGVRDPETARRIAEFADAVIVGSRLVQEIEAAPREAVTERVTAFIAGVRAAMDNRARTGVPA